MLISEANTITGGLSSPSKMPGKAYSIPATRCKVGSKLVKKEGSVCHGCYALKGRYHMLVVKQALERRYLSLSNPLWGAAMVVLIQRQSPDYFRWHDSGDLQSVNHLRKICDVCYRTPDTSHWLPTREVVIVRDYLKAHGSFPANLICRISSHMVDGPPLPYPHTSTVVTTDATCPAPHQGGRCQDCRACWDHKIRNVSYGIH